MKSAVDVNDEDVLRMVEESVEHAFEDLAARRWIEAKLKAQETVKATKHGLAQCGEEIEPTQKAEIEAAIQRIEAVLATQNGTGAGDLNQLKTAHAELDAATKPLADLMMDKAMEAMLRKRGLI